MAGTHKSPKPIVTRQNVPEQLAELHDRASHQFARILALEAQNEGLRSDLRATRTALTQQNVLLRELAERLGVAVAA